MARLLRTGKKTRPKTAVKGKRYRCGVCRKRSPKGRNQEDDMPRAETTRDQGDPFDLARFTSAQEAVYDRALAEIRGGDKRSHWMWFIFPQIAGLGFSAMAQRYAISSREEAAAYLAHDILGPRLGECTRLVLGIEGRTIRTILGSPDDLKFR